MPEDSLGGSMAGGFSLGAAGRPNMFQRAIFGKQGLTGTASASLKFDIPGLESFRTELVKIRASVKDLGDSFKALAASPKSFSAELEKVNAQLVAMNKNVGNTKGLSTGTGVSAGSAGKAASTASQTMSPSALPPGSSGVGAGAAGMAAGAGGIGGMVTQVLSMPFNRAQSGADAAKAADVYLSRLALSTGRTGRQELGRIGQQAPFLGNLNDISQTMYALSQQGYVVGGQGRAGQAGAAAAGSIRMLQSLSPGMGTQEAGQMFMGQAANIAGQRQAMPLLGQAAWAFNATGTPKPLNQRYKEVLDALQRQSNHPGTPFTKEQLIASQVPGSAMLGYLSLMGWDEGMISQFFEYAIAATQYGAGFTGAPDQMKKVRGPSIAENQAEVVTKKAERDAKYGADQYKTILAQQNVEKDLVDALRGLDSTLKGFYGIIGRAPTGWGQQLAGLAGTAADTAAKAAVAAGDPPGLSQLNPDVRSRIGRMMAANPNLQVVSGYRTNQQQKRLYESGNPYMAPPGKSHHGRGAAADLGPASQYGWIQRNAKRFGLDHAAGQGEPWHVQLSGTMFGIGDVSPEERSGWVQEARSFGQQVAMAGFMQEQQKQQAAAGGAVGAIQSGIDNAVKNVNDAVAQAKSGVSGGKGPLSWDDLAKVAYNAGFRGEALKKMIAIAGGESGRNPGSYNPVGRDNSYGLWQINMKNDDPTAPGMGTARLKSFGIKSNDELFDPDTNARAAFILSGGGMNLQPWNMPKNSPTPDLHTKYLPEAEQAMKDLGYGDVGVGGGGYGGGNGSQVSLTHQPVTFHNTFNVTVSGNSGTDIDRMVRQMASKLEGQMQRVQVTRR